MSKFGVTILPYDKFVEVYANSAEEAKAIIQKRIDTEKDFLPPPTLDVVEMIDDSPEPNEKYFRFLEHVREMGVCNMYGAGPYLQEAYGLSQVEANKVLVEWMNRYDELSKKYGWRR